MSLDKAQNELVNVLEVAEDLSAVRVRRTATIVPRTIDIPVPQNERVGWISYDSIRAMDHLAQPYTTDLGPIISLEDYLVQRVPAKSSARSHYII